MKLCYDKKLKRWRDKKGRFVSRRIVKAEYRRRYRKGIRKRVPKVPVPKTMWRYTFCINYVIHHKYYAVRGQTWRAKKEELTPKVRAEVEKAVIAKAEEEVGYPQSEWWWVYQFADGVQEVLYDKKLIGQTEVAVEFIGEHPRPKPHFIKVKNKEIRIHSRKAEEKERIQRQIEDFLRELT